MNKKTTKTNVDRISSKTTDKCEWMSSGFVSYKICDRNYECLKCPIEIGLRGLTSSVEWKETERQIDENEIKFSPKYLSFLSNLISMKKIEDFFVHPGHIWIKLLKAGKLQVGIDDIVANSLGSIDEIVLPNIDEKINRGESLGQIIQFEHTFSIVSPISGIVSKINNELLNFPNELILDPLYNGWIFEFKSDSYKQDLKYCRTGDNLFAWYLKEYTWFESKLSSIIQQPNDDELSLLNKAESSRSLRNYLAGDSYRRFILSLIGCPEI